MGFTALWWWIDRWRKSSAFSEMTNEEQGAYRNLLDEAVLRGGSLPNDDRILAKASGDAVRWPVIGSVTGRVMAHFTLGADNRWHNATLEKVMAESARRATKQKSYRNRRADNTGGNTRGNAHGNRAHTTHGNRAAYPNTLSNKKKTRRNRVCPHTPTCATWTSCTTLILDEARQEKAGKS